MPSTLSTQKRSCRDWTSLPFDIVVGEGRRLLAADDIDYYMAFRKTCHNWRLATKDYPEKADYTDPTHFQPRKWALLDQRDDLVMLVNIDTGRFLCKSIPLLLEYFFVGATGGGLILLGGSTYPHHACVLNPFTGSIAHFKVPVPVAGVRTVVVTTTPLMVFISTEIGEIMWADQNSEHFKSFWSPYPNKTTCLTSFTGQVYATDQQGSVISSAVVGDAIGEQRLTISMETAIPSLETSPDTSRLAWLSAGRYYLVESGEDLLFVTKPSYLVINHPVVHRVDTERKALVPLRSIGNRAIFVGSIRCLSIDADKFHGIKGGCIYFVEPDLIRGYDYKPPKLTVFQLANQRQRFIMLGGCFRPFTLTQVLADYCRSSHYSELFRMHAIESALDLSSDSESDESSSSEADVEALSSEFDE